LFHLGNFEIEKQRDYRDEKSVFSSYWNGKCIDGQYDQKYLDTFHFERSEETPVMRKMKNPVKQLKRRLRGAVFVEYIILVTIVGIGVIVGLATVRQALVNELFDLAAAINAIVC
jgi:pilus assembly protein Flp/PilA